MKLTVDGKEYSLEKDSIFSGGEVNIRLPLIKYMIRANAVCIKANLLNSDDAMKLLMAVDAVKREYRPKYMSLVMPYIPYARQDRVCSSGEPLSVKVFANLINSCGFDDVMVLMPHSDVSGGLLNNCDVNSLTNEWNDRLFSTLPDNCCIVSPDAGALKRVEKFMVEYGYSNLIKADKVRNLSSGEITKTDVYFDGSLSGTHCVILDDIVDGGRTFIELAKILREKGAAKITLAAPHGIFSKGLKVFDGLIDEVITSDSFPKPAEFNNVKLTVINN